MLLREQLTVLNLTAVRQITGLRQGSRFVIPLLRPEMVIRGLGVVVFPTGLRIYRLDSDGEVMPGFEQIGIATSPCPFGGVRRWLLCPECRRRTSNLYFHRIEIRCRLCLSLTYQSQRERPVARARRRAESIRVALGGSGDLKDPFPDRPWGMHRMTYDKLRRKAQEAEDLVRSRPERHWRKDH